MNTVRRLFVVALIVWFSLGSPAAVFAQEAVDATGQSTGTIEPTGAPECTGASCHQGEGQGHDQGMGQGVTNGIDVSNTNTGADSTNTETVDVSATSTTGVNNTAVDTTAGAATATTGGNNANMNTGTGGITSGDAGIGVTQVKNDNTAVIGGTAGLTTSGYNGDHQGDLNLGFGAGTATLSGPNGGSVRATNETTGGGSTNTNDVTTTTEEIVEVQNDGQISNILDLAAITGQNEASQNTGDGRITTGDADVAAVLINLLNTTVQNGDIWVTVANVFGSLAGNILIDDLATLASAARGQTTTIDASNNATGSNSDNTTNIALTDTERTRVNNDADIRTTFDAQAITGQNTADANTGGSLVATGDASVTGSNVSIANTTVEGGNWGLFIVNALNGWFGYLVGDSGEVRALSQEETIREIDARNEQTGTDSQNTNNITDETTRVTEIDNNARITNDVNAQAITGQNQANENTGQGIIETGNANVQATAVNIANTTVKNGSLFIAVVNIFGDWLGDLFYDGNSLAQAAAAQQAAHQVDINAENTNTGAGSTNDVNINIDRTHETDIQNNADLRFTLNAQVDTGSNRANRNTLGAAIQTGQGFLAQHSRAVANTTGIAGQGGLAVTMDGENTGTGFDSRNTIRANINDSRIITITNNANVSTLLGSLLSPVLINTGSNEANQNTGGAAIVTGNANADVAIHNLVNKVIIALMGEGVEVDANFTNTLTGALSTNGNTLNVVRTTLASIFNTALVDTILNILLNTGSNTANENTGGAAISAGAAGFGPAAVGGTSIATGAVCVDVVVANNVNAVAVTGVNGLTVSNTGVANTQHNVTGTTGNNQMEGNTAGGSTSGQSGDCERIAMVPSPTPGPGGVGGGPAEPTSPAGHGASGDVGGSEEARVVGEAKDERPSRIAGHHILTRFPVAGGNVPWLALVVGGFLLTGIAWHLDRRARLAH